MIHMRIAGLLLFLCLAVPAAQRAHAGVVSPGSMPNPGPDDGLLLLAVDSSVNLDSVRVKKEGKLFSSGVLLNITAAARDAPRQ